MEARRLSRVEDSISKLVAAMEDELEAGVESSINDSSDADVVIILVGANDDEILASAADIEVGFSETVAFLISDDRLANFADMAVLVTVAIIELKPFNWEASAGFVAVAKYDEIEANLDETLAALFEELTEAITEDIDANLLSNTGAVIEKGKAEFDVVVADTDVDAADEEILANAADNEE